MAKGIGAYMRKGDIEYFRAITICAYCGADGATAIDHILPPRLGGDSSRSNLTKACTRCNSIKSDLSVFGFYQRVVVHRNKIDVSGYVSRLRMARKKDVNPDLQQWLIDKIAKCRRDHSRYTRIINSLLRSKYKNG